ncbi:MAG TPA: tannase/feruloyl esterase family alpha/beta hydrolase [Steroidobacteraceae bacterium]|nr:tannase/feruloyl esterase family alpha/beta hydrolase [Steroidobacteraceae bacterium]
MSARALAALLPGLLAASSLILPLRVDSAQAQAAAPGAAIAPGRTCSALRDLTLNGTNLTVTRADPVPAAPAGTVPLGPGPNRMTVPLPAYCRFEGVIDAHVGADGKHYGLTIAVALPDAWNGRFLVQGGGGLNGTLNPPLGAQAAGERPALARGFAVVSTDGGHRGAGFDASFEQDQQAALDFAFNAVPTVTSIAKRVVAAYYGRPPVHSYFAGCSTGGREGMEAVERYPAMFDGVITGAPAMRTGYSNLALKWAAVAFNQIAPKDPATGKPIPGGAFTATDRELIVHGLLKACDALDGLKDGMIFNVKACRFDPRVLECRGAKTPGCLSSAQVEALHEAFNGPVTGSGWRIYAPHPYDTGIAMEPRARFGIPGFLFNSTAGPVGGGALPVSMDLERDVAEVVRDPEQQLIDTAEWTNLSTFAAHGGKQLFYHGMSDPWFSAYDTIAYYERLARANGGLQKTRGFARLFLVPGMGHCQGGPATLDRFDLLTPLVHWVEQGSSPEAVVATGDDFPGRSRPLCAWPQHAQYRGHGNPNEAASFECRD